MRAEHADARALLAEFKKLLAGRVNDSVLGQKAGYDPANPFVYDIGCILAEAEVCRLNRVMMMAQRLYVVEVHERTRVRVPKQVCKLIKRKPYFKGDELVKSLRTRHSRAGGSPEGPEKSAFAGMTERGIFGLFTSSSKVKGW